MLTVLQEGSITSAAKKLYVSQPSLSQMIKLVETNLGTPIFSDSYVMETALWRSRTERHAGASCSASKVF